MAWPPTPGGGSGPREREGKKEEEASAPVRRHAVRHLGRFPLGAALDRSGGWLVPRNELVGALQVLLQGGRLKVAPALPEAALLVQELVTFKARSLRPRRRTRW